MSLPTSRRAGLGLGQVLLIAVLACASPAPQVDLPEFASVSAMDIDPGCSPSGCPPPRVVTDPGEVAFLLALHHALNKDWQTADAELCRSDDRPRRSTYLDADGRPLLVVFEHITSRGVQLAYENPETGCQATPVWTRKQYSSAMEAAKGLYHHMLRAAGEGER
jgi:hypothetical protein